MTDESRSTPHEAIELGGSVWLRSGEATLGGAARIALLAAIHQTGSITGAAKAVGMSYKAAWDAIDTMNNLAGTTLVFGAAYTLWMVKRVIYGAVANDHVAALKDVNRREMVFLVLLAVAVLAMGVYPKPLSDVMNPSIQELLRHVSQSKAL